jgi:membrane associated rhomboid family serine protease
VTEPRREPGSSRQAAITAVLVLLGLMWGLEVVDVALDGRLDRLGIEPRDADGLTGVVLAPLLHDGFWHLIGNTVPFVVLGVVVALGGLTRLVAVTAIVTLVGGFLTWLLGPGGTNHIGASGLVFGYAAYLVARGFFDRRVASVAIGVLVAVVYGTTLLFGLVPRPGISWQGHLFGAAAGVLAARLLAGRGQVPERSAR